MSDNTVNPMRKKVTKYALWSDELLEDKWKQLSSKREKLVNKISKYDVQMQEVKEQIEGRKRYKAGLRQTH